MTTETPVEEQPIVSTESVTPPAEETVSKVEFERVLSEMHKYKGQLREISTASQVEKERLLKEQNNWQELAQIHESRSKAAEERLNMIQESLVNKEKFSALKDAAMRAGIKPEALSDLELVGLDKVQVETTSTGRVNVIGVSQAIDGLKLSRPHWFGGSPTRVSGALPTVASTQGLVTEKELIKLSVEAQKNSDYATYEQKLKEYKQQKRKA